MSASTFFAASSPEGATATTAAPMISPLVPASKQEAPAPPPGKQKPPPKDPEDDGSNGGLGRLPKGVDPEYEGVGVTCVSQSTGRPIGDVAVRAMTTKDLEAWSIAHGGASVDDEDPKVVLDSVTTPAKTSQYGIAITDSGPGRMLVDARLGTLYAFKWIDRNKVTQVKLTMVEDHDLEFRTHAADGSAVAGVPVVVSNAQCVEIWRGITKGDDASVRMRHANFLIELDPTPGSCTAFIEGVLPTSSPIGLMRGGLPAKAIDLFLPASHSIRVHVKDPKGQPVSRPFAAMLTASDESTSCGDRSSGMTKEGVVTFDRVETGAAAKSTLYLDGGDVFESVRSTVDSSQHDVDVSFARAFRVARVHVEDAAGKPLVQGHVRLWLRTGNIVHLAGHVEYVTGMNGELGIPLGSNGTMGWANFAQEDAQISSISLVQLDPAGDTVASIEIPIPADFADGERDLGSVRLKELPFLVQGYVVDDRDAAVPLARVRLREKGSEVPGFGFPSATSPGWVANSDTSGFFKLRATLPDGDIDLVCDAPDHVMMPLAHVERGDRKVRIVMSRFGTLLSKFILPPGMPSELVSMDIESGAKHTTGKLDNNAIVHVTNLAPGKIKVVVSVAGLAKPVVSLDEIEVKPGLEVTDAHVTQIDLRQRVYYRTLHVNDPDGKPISYVNGRVVEVSEDHRPPRRIEGQDGVVTVVTTQAGVDLEISAPGFVTQTLHDIDKDTDVVLERTPR